MVTWVRASSTAAALSRSGSALAPFAKGASEQLERQPAYRETERKLGHAKSLLVQRTRTRIASEPGATLRAVSPACREDASRTRC